MDYATTVNFVPRWGQQVSAGKRQMLRHSDRCPQCHSIIRPVWYWVKQKNDTNTRLLTSANTRNGIWTDLLKVLFMSFKKIRNVVSWINSFSQFLFYVTVVFLLESTGFYMATYFSEISSKLAINASRPSSTSVLMSFRNSKSEITVLSLFFCHFWIMIHKYITTTSVEILLINATRQNIYIQHFT